MPVLLNTSIVSGIISPIVSDAVESVVLITKLYGRVAYFDGSDALKTGVKLDPSTDQTLSFTFVIENVSSAPNIVSDRSTERMFNLNVLADGRLFLGTEDSLGFTQTKLLDAGGIVNNVRYRVEATYTQSTKTWSVNVNGSTVGTHAHTGTFTVGNLGEITLADTFSGAGVNMVGTIYDVNMNDANAWAGHGIQAGNWVDLIGSADIVTGVSGLTLYAGTV